MPLPTHPSFDVLYSNKDHKRIKNLLKIQLFFMACMGQIPIIVDEFFPAYFRGFGSLLLRIYSGFVVLTTLHTCILFTKTTFDMLQHGELDEIIDALTQTIINAFACFATCYFLWHSRVLQQFIELIESEYWHHSLVGLTYASSFSAYKTAQRITLYWQISALFGVVLWGLAPLIQGHRALPLKCWYPFDPLQPWIYPIVYSIQMFTQVNIGITFANGSALFLSFIFILLGQFDVLFCSLKNLPYHARLTAGDDLRALRILQTRLPQPQNEEVNQYIFAVEERTNLSKFKKKFQKRAQLDILKSSLLDCIKLHRFICDCCSTLEGLYHPYCLIKSLQITIQLCLLVFVGVAGERSVMRLFNLFQYLALTIAELMMFCFCGELLRQHSLRSGDALFRSQWHSYAPLVRTDLLIFLVNSKRTIRLTAGKFFAMDLERLRSVVMQAFSFLTLLQKLAQKNENE